MKIIRTYFKHIILFSITFIFIPQNSYAGQTYKDCFIPREFYGFFAILKGQTVPINNNPFITYTASETGFYKFFVYDFKAHEDDRKCSDHAVYGNWFPYCKGESPPLEVDAWPPNYVWRYIGQFTVTHDFRTPCHNYGCCYQNFGWETLAVYLYTNKQDCEVSINISPSEVWPKGAGNDDKTTATIMVTSTNPPSEGCTVDLKVEPVKDSGGHIESGHTGDRNNHKGSIKDITLIIPSGSSQASTTYQSNEVSGEEKIIAEINGEKKGETTVSVKVPGLTQLEDGENYDLKVSTNSHPSSYWGAMDTLGYFISIANSYAVTFPNDERLVVTGISLPWGGVFDLCGTYNPANTCAAAANGGHRSHRTGRDVDVRKWNIPKNNVQKFKEICLEYGAVAGNHGNHYHLDF